MKILVADDSKTTLGMLTEQLKKLGHAVSSATNGQEAIVKFQNERPDLIILDVMMKGMNGFECASLIRALSPDDWIPIIFLSATVDDKHISKGIDAGGDDYLAKPYSEITLAAKIKAMQRISDMRLKLVETTEKLAELSSTDALTGISNRLEFDKAIKEKFANAKRYNKQLALLYIDLNKFKIVNDSLGHSIGDLLLKEVSRRLKASLRLDDFIARLGGDEFGIIITDIKDKNVVGNIANKIIKLFSEPFNLAGNELNVYCSVGIAVYIPEEMKKMDINTLTQQADIAMYHAKESGTNSFQYFDEEIKKQHSQQMDLENALRFAIDKQELYLMYQPIFHLKTREITRVEVYCAWNNQTFGRISANVFIPIAEDIGIIDSISLWIFENACLIYSKWLAQGRTFKLSINISPRQLMQKDLRESILAILEKNHIPTEKIEFELTETAPFIYSELYGTILKQIHETGITIALDDFGTVYSSLSHLKHLPITTIKIDKAFSQEMAHNKDTEMLVKSIITLGTNLGFEVVAEGIETKEQLDCLLKHDCQQGQGYYLCKPKEAKEITAFFEEAASERENE